MKMSLKIRKDFNDIVVIHQGIINHLKAQKVRHDGLMEKYGQIIETEMEIPSNRFLNWTRSVKPYQDSVVTSKLIDFELIQEYEKFIKDLVAYENGYIISEAIIQDMEYGYDLTIEATLRLEKKLSDLKQRYNKEIIQSKLHAINIYQALPNHLKRKEGYCIYCGIHLNMNAGDTDDECLVCQNVPDDLKPITDSGIIKDDLIMKRKLIPTVTAEDVVEDVVNVEDVIEDVKPEGPIPFIEPDKVNEENEVEIQPSRDNTDKSHIYDKSHKSDKSHINDKDDKSHDPQISNEVSTEPEDDKDQKPKEEKKPIKKTMQDRKINSDFKKLMADFEGKYKDTKKKLDGDELDNEQ